MAIPAHEQAIQAISGVISCVGSPGFAQDALVQVNRWLPVSWWSVFRLHDDAPPVMPCSGSYRAADRTGESWQEYRSTLYRQDETFVAARERVQAGEQMLVHWHAREIAHAHRERIYTRFGLRERLSIVCKEDAHASMLAVNLYRHDALAAFSDQEIDLVGGAAGLLISCVRRHLELLAPRNPGEALFGALTRREREVCERMLKGWTHDGIAADLGVSAGTVKTYRDRAFDRLGIHHRNELFALASGYRSVPH